MIDTTDTFQEDSIDFRKYFYVFLNSWYLFVIFSIVSFAAAYYVNKFTTTVYHVKTTILIDAANQRKGAENLISGLNIFSDKKNIENEIGILHSYSLTKKVIEELDFDIAYYAEKNFKRREIYTDCPFVVEMDSGHNQVHSHPIKVVFVSKNRVLIETYEIVLANNRTLKLDKEYNIGEKVENRDMSFTINYRKGVDPETYNFNEDVDYYFALYSKNALVNLYRSKLRISPLNGESSILQLSTKGEVPLKEVDFLNKLCEVYIGTDLEEKNLIAKNTIQFIDERLSTIFDSLELAEDNLQNFLLANRIINLSEEGSYFMNKYEQLQNDKTLFEVKTDYYNYLLKYLSDKRNFDDIVAPDVMGIENPLLDNLIKGLSELYQEKKILLLTATKKNPALDILNIKIEDTRQILFENINNVTRNLKISIKGIEDKIYVVNSRIKSLPIVERELLAIKRKFNLSNNVYNYMLEKRAEASIAQASNIPDNKVIDIALVSNVSRVAPKKSTNYGFALIFGLLIPFLILIGKEFFNDKIADRTYIDNNTKLPIIGAIGNNSKDSGIPVFSSPRSAIAESFRSLRTNLQYLCSEKDSKVISITSTMSGEGKTFCAINLASIIAMTNKKVAIVGLDMRKPRLSKSFPEIETETGISSFLIGREDIEDVIFPSNIKNLSVVPSGPIPPNPSELIELERMNDLMEYLKSNFEYVIIDTPPLGLVTDALLVSRYADVNIFVIRHNYSRKDVLGLINDFDQKGTLKNISLVINDIKLQGFYGAGSKLGYGYGYSYGYGYNSYGYGGYGYGHGYYDEEYKPLSTSEKLKAFFNLGRNKNV